MAAKNAAKPSPLKGLVDRRNVLMEKPTRTEDLIPKFRVIGEPGWDDEVRKILTDYEVPIPEPLTEDELARRETELGFRLNEELRLFLKTFGAVNFEGLPNLFSLEQIGTLEDNIWFRDCLNEEQLLRLKGIIGVGNCLSDDVFGLEL